MRVCYATREAVMAATDQAVPPRLTARVDAAIAAAADTVDKEMRRPAGFYPTVATRYLDWPPAQPSRSHVLWLDELDLLAVTALTAGGTTVAPGDYLLRPDGRPPFNRVEINLAGGAAFAAGDTTQRAIAITGTWGYCDTTAAAGALTEGLDAVETEVDVTDSAAVGVGDLVLIDTERMLVTGKRMVATGQTLLAPLTAQVDAQTVSVTDGAAFAVGEVLLVDAERLLVDDIAGNTLVVKRAHGGTRLAVHTGSAIWAPRTLVVERGVLGTTAATHSAAAAVRRHQPPGPIAALNLALAVCELQQQSAGYARTAGSGDNQRETAGRGLAQAWKAAAGYKRRGRGPWTV
ncbi:MAG TPA: hypothetical protein VGD67_12145 [Pseudonocardiaceae bacterium]